MVIVRWSISFRYYNGLSSGLLSRGALTEAIVSAQQGNLPHLLEAGQLASFAHFLKILPHLPSSLLEAGHVTSCLVCFSLTNDVSTFMGNWGTLVKEDDGQLMMDR